MDELDLLLSLLLAAATGLLIGLERESTDLPPGDDGDGEGRAAGVRTFPLISLSGALSVLLGRALGPWVPLLALAGVVTYFATSYALAARHRRDAGLTTEVAALVTFLLGALAMTDVLGSQHTKLVVVAAVAVGVTALLALKPTLHRLARRVSRADLYATLQFLLAAAVILPLVPDRDMGPLAGFNPYKTVLMVVLISGISFAGYVAVRLLGPGRGLGVTGLLGGLVSSTAITLSMSSRVRDDRTLVASCALAVLLASAIMFVRVVAEVAVVHLPLVDRLAVPMGAMFLAGLAWTVVVWRQARGEEPTTSDLTLGNPFQLTSAVGFGLLYAAVNFIARAASHYAGDTGLYLAGLLAGTTDVDAITLSMANQVADGTVGADAATVTILIAAGSNVVVKGAMAASLGGWRFGRKVLIGYGCSVVAGAAALAATQL